MTERVKLTKKIHYVNSECTENIFPHHEMHGKCNNTNFTAIYNCITIPMQIMSDWLKQPGADGFALFL